MKRAVVRFVIVIAAVVAISLGSKPASKDYISYWAAGQALAHHSDPYSPSGVLAIERTQGYALAKPVVIMRNPPWALFLTVPLGWMSARAGLVLWTAATLGCILMFLQLANATPRDRLLAYCFAPVVGCAASGQSSPFLLLGFSLFLFFHRRRPFAAGAALLLMAIKPHLFLVFWPILLIDCIYRKSYRLLVGSSLAILGATAFTMYLDPHAWSNYLAMLRDSHLDAEFLQTPSYLLRCLAAPKSPYVQLLPSLAAIGWSLWFYARNRLAWDWRIHGMPLMLVTVLVSPYAWMTDEIVLLPSIMFAFANQSKARYSTPIFVALNGIAVVMLMAQISLHSGAYLWTPAAWLGWYLYSQHQKESMASPAQASKTLFQPAAS